MKQTCLAVPSNARGVQCRLQVQREFTYSREGGADGGQPGPGKVEEGNLSACGGTGMANTAERPAQRLGTASPRGPATPLTPGSVGSKDPGRHSQEWDPPSPLPAQGSISFPRGRGVCIS